MFKYFFTLIVLFLTNSAFAGQFITKWQLNQVLPSFNLDVQISGPVNYTWEEVSGSGITYSGVINSNNAVIFNPGSPTYKIWRLKLDSTNLLYFNAIHSKHFLIDVEQWGTVKWNSFEKSFYECYNLNSISAKDIPDLSNVSSMSSMFQGCVNLSEIQNINKWDMSNVLDLSFLFSGCYLFNQPINNWDVSKAIYMRYMFAGSISFKSSFNQPINNWDVHNVIDMSYMFCNATSFNQSLSNWSFNDSVSFDQMLNNCDIDCENYASSLIGWASNVNTPNSLNLSANGLNYNDTATIFRNFLITNKSWSIAGDSICTSSIDQDNSKLSLFYPNPTTDFSSIKIISNKNQKIEYVIYDLTGKKLRTQVIELSFGTNILKFDLMNLNKGIYNVAFYLENGEFYYRKLVASYN
jgi:surface protein